MANSKIFTLSLITALFIGGTHSLMCYDCYNENDNDECNGVSPGSNSTGVMVECPATMATPSCHSGFKMNANGDGWVIRKECMEYDECYDRFYGNTLDPDGSACFDDSPVGNTVCINCCLDDGCNSDYKYSWYTMPNSNNWNPEVDIGYPTTTTAAPTLPSGGGAENGAAHHAVVVTMSLLFTILPCLI